MIIKKNKNDEVSISKIVDLIWSYASIITINHGYISMSSHMKLNGDTYGCLLTS